MILSSIWRNSRTDAIDRYAKNVRSLANRCELDVIVAVGDDNEGTQEKLERVLAGNRHTILRVDHGGPAFASIDEPRRWRQIAVVCNAVLNAVSWRIREGEPFVYHESDLIVDVDVIETLCKWIECGADAVAPMSFCADHKTFYDTWGYVRDGTPFTSKPPYTYPIPTDTPFPIDSAGSCIVMADWLARVVRFGEDDCVRGLGRSIRENGGTLWLDPTLSVIHP